MTNKLYLFGTIILLIIFSLIVFEPLKSKENVLSVQSQQPSPTQTITPSLPSAAEKIEILHFHATQQCWSCIAVGEYALKTIEEKFPSEYQSGKIIFKDINGELLENREVVKKFKAGASSLFINVIKDGQDHIEEDVTVWRLINNQSQFINYFEAKLKALL